MKNKQSKLYFRFVEKEDCNDLLRWRNDPVTRAKSFNTKKITLKEHFAWFERTLKNPSRNILIGINEQAKKIGMIRFDQDPQKNTVEVNIVVAPEERGKCYGTELIRKGCETFFNNYLYEYIIAKIKKANLPSIKIFQRVGFIKVDEKEDYTINHLKRKDLR